MKRIIAVILALSVSVSMSCLAADESAPKAEAAKLPVLAGFGNLTLGGLIQVWFVSDPTKEFSKGAANDSTFRVRRAEIKVSGDLVPELGFSMMLDMAKALKVTTATNATGAVTGVTPDQSTTVLQDVTANLRLGRLIPGLDAVAPKMELWIGQQKTGITEEGPRPSSKLDFPERSQIARTYADKRDIGFLVKDSHQYADYTVGLFNGAGMNTPDNNDNKTAVGHITLKVCPWNIVKVGASGLIGESGADKADQDRYGFDIQAEKGPLSLKAEYLQGKDGAVDFEGYYIQPGCFIIADTLQVVGRFDSYDKNTDISNDNVQEISGGLNYFIAKHNAKVMLDYMRRNNEASTDENVFMVAVQALF